MHRLIPAAALLVFLFMPAVAARAQDDSAQKALDALTKALDTTKDSAPLTPPPPKTQALDALDKALDKAAKPAPQAPAAQQPSAGKSAPPRPQDKKSPDTPRAKGKRELMAETEQAERCVRKPGQASAFRDYAPQLDHVFFYESDKSFTRAEDRLYQNSFVLNTTRYVNWEIRFNFRFSFDAPYSFKLKAVWTYPSGKTVEQEGDFNIKPDWENLSLTWGRGFEEPGKWQKGNYKVDIYIEGEHAASGKFILF